MPATTTPAPTFDLLVPANGRGASHLRLPGGPGFVCGARTGSKLYQQMGITSSAAGTCEPCRIGARAVELAASAPWPCDVVTGARGTGTVVSTIGGVLVQWRDGGQSRVTAAEVTVTARPR